VTTRTIVTSQPDVACDVCARRLLRGELPDVFVSAGRRRIVCELCAPRATHAGWLRETDSQPMTLPPARPRRGGGLLERLAVSFRPRRPDSTTLSTTSPANGSADPKLYAEAASSSLDAATPLPVQAPDQLYAEVSSPDVSKHDLVEPALAAAVAAPTAPTPPPAGSTPAEPSAYLLQALEVFNASEFPRRVAGVMRSLGPPLVTVRSAEHLASVVRIVVAWELCWYCYEVDLSEPLAEAQVIAQGSELAELAREDRTGNAAAADTGALLLENAV